jgi:hypothetical protein
MEALTRLVTDSLARHGFDRPIDPRRLQWSRWSRCDSPHSLLVVPSKPGIFALAEEIMDLGPGKTTAPETAREGHDFSRAVSGIRSSTASVAEEILGGAALQRCDSPTPTKAASAAEVPQRRMLAVLQFSEDDDMAFTLDRMFTRINPMRDRLATGRCFLRFVVIEDQAQRCSICAALNQWMLSSSEKASGLPADFQSSLEFAANDARVARTLLSDTANTVSSSAGAEQSADMIHSAPHLDSGANKNLHCPHPLPSGF